MSFSSVLKYLGSLLVISFILAVGLFFVWGIWDVQIQNIEIDTITQDKVNSFTFSGNLAFYNPSLLSLGVSRVEYGIVFEDTGEAIGLGELDQFILERKATTMVPIEQKIILPASVIFDLNLDEKKIPLLLQGNAVINVFGLKEYAIPFQQEVNGKDFFGQMPIDDDLLKQVILAKQQ